MLDNRVEDVPGKHRYEYFVYDSDNIIVGKYRTDDPASVNLIRTFADDCVARLQAKRPGDYRIEYFDNNKKVDKRIRDSYRITPA